MQPIIQPAIRDQVGGADSQVLHAGTLRIAGLAWERSSARRRLPWGCCDACLAAPTSRGAYRSGCWGAGLVARGGGRQAVIG